MSPPPIRVPCLSRTGEWQRHRWETVPGVMSTTEHSYTERRCRRCGIYESEIR
jgi:hypothetical protein